MSYLFLKIVSIPAILLGFTCHEYAHAKMADRLGDKTPRFQGRLTFNPLKHIDPIGTLLILFVGFGWAKPVETNPSAYKNYYKDDLKVSLAGPMANLILGFLAYLVFKILIIAQIKTGFLPQNIYVVFYYMLYYTFIININLFVFNILPLPGLDGFHILRDIKPDIFYRISDKLYQYQMVIMILIVVGGYKIIRVPVSFIANIIKLIVNSIFNVFI
ncbi:MAG: site-2 protease family protein [Clostridiaceae bacterium]|nr:site-2 protease family protein [Clostridiaceae bacterium]